MKSNPLEKKYPKKLPWDEEKRKQLGEMYDKWPGWSDPDEVVVEVEVGGNVVSAYVGEDTPAWMMPYDEALIEHYLEEEAGC